LAKRSNSNSISEQRVKDEETLVVSSVRLLQSQYPARVKHQGKVTGDWYEWPGAGAKVPVAAEDAEYLLSLRINSQPCCNSINKPQPKFVEV
jgi:hypothetical protein